MNGEMEENPSAWTTETLKQHYDKLRESDQTAIRAALVSQEKAVAAALAAAEKAVTKAETASEKRFDSVNEFRKTLSDQTASFLPRPEYDANHKALEDKIDTKYQALDDKMTLLTTRVDKTEGQTQGSQLTKGNIITYLGVGFGFVSLIVLLANKVF